MARAGFYAIESHSIRFGRDGEWYSDGERIANGRIALLFSRCLTRTPQGTYVLQMGDERAPVEIEDTPYVVRQIDGEPRSGFSLMLNDGSVESLDPATLRVGADDALYCRVKQGESEARFLRPAHYALARWVRAQDGGFVLESGDSAHRIASR